MIYAISEIKKGRVPVIELVILIALSIVLFSSINKDEPILITTVFDLFSDIFN